MAGKNPVQSFLQQVIAQHVEPYREAADSQLREDGPTYDLGAE